MSLASDFGVGHQVALIGPEAQSFPQAGGRFVLQVLEIPALPGRRRLYLAATNAIPRFSPARPMEPHNFPQDLP